MGPAVIGFSDQRHPPTWDGESKPFQHYLKEIETWLEFTNLEKEVQGQAITLSLAGAPQQLVLTMEKDKRTGKDGAKNILAELRKVYLSSDEHELFSYFEDLVS